VQSLLDQDLRNTPLYQEAESIHRALRRPTSGLISDAAEVTTDGRRVVFAGSIVDRLNGTPASRICATDLSSGDTRVITFGPHTDRAPKFSPDGDLIAFLSDREGMGNFQLYLLDLKSGGARAAPRVEGWVEYLHWSPDGRRIVLGVAGHGAETSGTQGAVRSQQAFSAAESWMPRIERGSEAFHWRRNYVYEVGTNTLRRVGTEADNVWEASWCGNDALVVISSTGPGEGLWYSARLKRVQLDSGESQELYAPKDQLGWPAGSPDGRWVAVVEAVCSDRWVVAGDLKLIQIPSGKIRCVDTNGVDITYVEWCSAHRMIVGGHRGFETVVGRYEPTADSFVETWKSVELSTAGRYFTAAALGDQGDCVVVGESFTRAPEIAVIRGEEYRAVRSFDLGYDALIRGTAQIEQISWSAPDGLALQGWLLRPVESGPCPLVMHIHGGPIWQIRPMWLGRYFVHVLMLLNRGCAVFFPNPRGSSGRGREFARRVLGDVGGSDTQDYLSGLDALVERGIADPARLGVTGGSYGGFMTSWLITQDDRFAAAVAVAPVTNQVTAQLLSSIPHFVELSLADRYTNSAGKYFQRSPIMHASRVRTPTLHICGALDRCTPPVEAEQFHSALLQNGAESVLVTYPEEGHGISRWPACIDYAARLVCWFELHMAANREVRS